MFKEFFSIALLVFLCEVASDIYAPSLVAIQNEFLCSTFQSSFTMSLNILSLAISALIYGPLSDRLGRRPVVLTGFLIFVIASFGAVTARSIFTLIIWRVFQGIGGGVGPIMGYACISDKTRGDACASALSKMAMVTALSPALGPIIGGVFATAFGWQGGFYFVGLASLGLWLWLEYHFEEPLKVPLKPLPFLHYLKLSIYVDSYRKLLTSTEFMRPALAAALMISSLWAEVAGLPVIYMDGMGITLAHYSVAFSLLVLCFVLGAMVNHAYVIYYGGVRMIRLGFALISSSLLALTLMILFDSQSLHPTLIQAVKVPGAFGLALTISNLTSMALGPCKGNSGAASALIASMHMVMGALAIGCAAYFYDGTVLPLTVVSWLALGGALLLKPF